jgi:hypothetical protein
MLRRVEMKTIILLITMYYISANCIVSSAVAVENDIMNTDWKIDSLEVLHLLIGLRGF